MSNSCCLTYNKIVTIICLPLELMGLFVLIYLDIKNILPLAIAIIYSIMIFVFFLLSIETLVYLFCIKEEK